MANPLTITLSEGRLRALCSRDVALYDSVPVSVTGLAWTAGHSYLAVCWIGDDQCGVVDTISEAVDGSSVVTWTYTFPFTAANLILACTGKGVQTSFGLWDATDERWVFQTPLFVAYALEPDDFVAVTPSVTAATAGQIATANASHDALGTAHSAIITKTGATDGQVAMYSASEGRYKPGSVAGAGLGDVTGPGSSTDGNIPVFNGATGKVIKESSVALATVTGHIANTSNPHSVTASQVSLGSVTNDAQTKAAVVPNTAPAAGEILVGNAGGTAFAKQALSGDATLASTGAITLFAAAKTATITFEFDGGGSAITDGTKAILPYLPCNFTPTRWTVVCSANDRTGAASNASITFAVTVSNFSTSAFPSGATGGTQPSVTTAVGATAASNFSDTQWDAAQSVMCAVSGTPTAKFATVQIQGTIS